jgi:nucleoside diphosphate kinase
LRGSRLSIIEDARLTPPQRGLIGPIISRFENRGFKLAAIKLITPSKEHLEKHYEDLSDKPFFPGLIACASPHPPPSTAPTHH